ncbi:uncharacterized protein BO87DRAFT_430645 [Aspergillus neoniger CBS 115656]|uniref:Uncharacterized protein n=1 Tax=Aspergillus neoniger (strain CBS 115656) TaxID=1448310 RepID=A0A318Y657_ASPNB|nr:hypothetical protein BO87DRAFT_430645 [Aspergillus neoniger CBS 115656]PYH29359.1 hypothetical protein BO87DRAFT_430645 [Aspergillus neoniger CBS 115656]
METETSACFQQALNSFKTQSGPGLVAEFEMTSLTDLKSSIAKIQTKQATERRMQNMRRISSFIGIMERYGEVIEVFLNTTNILAFVWGPMKFLLQVLFNSNHQAFMIAEMLQVASSVSEAFNELLETYKIIGEGLELLERCIGLIDGKTLVQRAVESMFHDIFAFHEIALAYFRKPMWKQVFQATWSTYKARFGPVVESFKRHKQVFEDRLTFVQLEDIRSKVITASEELEKLRNKEKLGQLREIQNWLNSADVASDQHAFTSARIGKTQTGSWILHHQQYCSWKKGSTQPLLWVNGIPGAGKTILASTIIEYCLNSHESTIWFYFRNGDAQRNSFLCFAASLISQTLARDTDLLPYVYEEMCRKGKQSFSSEKLAKELLDVMIKNTGYTCIILDGVDECGKVERKKILEWILQIIDHQRNPQSSDSIICAIVSQKDSITSKALRHIPSLEITSKDTRDDIFAYVSSRCSDIQNKFQLDDEDTKAIVELVMGKAGGMFLLAKLAMNNLYCQVSASSLFNELKTKDIPSQLDQAYDRILNNILEDHGSRSYAIQLLGWLVCAKRQLKWREIQGAVSVDLEAEDVDLRNRQWILDSKDLCDSLVEMRTDGSLELVHGTAKLFLIRTNLIDIRHVELSMASLCVGYLALPGFDMSLS